jgi:hypothetical protein
MIEKGGKGRLEFGLIIKTKFFLQIEERIKDRNNWEKTKISG